ncbi:hypothetical protein QZH56_13805 [Streptomyces olivoreticuli]|uniref:hypothetical protein n=1 Tax=Streptomyces olivoreticuli TaxID=68246 RepID=UPI00265A62A2|nr:hypothetical protein [Streptomyces olivoreticuli]WKK26568.1 hypothetical protein QZH56_13805 [Streptomyces olivoreticuli]
MSVTRQQLVDGGWADLRAPAEVPERLRRPVRRLQMRLAKDPAFASVVAQAQGQGVTSVADIDAEQAARMATAMGDESIELMDELNDAVVISRVIGWSYGDEVALDQLQNLPGTVYDQLRELCADGALAGPDFSPTPDPASPITPSTA